MPINSCIRRMNSTLKTQKPEELKSMINAKGADNKASKSLDAEARRAEVKSTMRISKCSGALMQIGQGL